jgi:hypothetical protein
MAETGGSELARPALIAPASPGAEWRRRGIVLDRYFTRVAILPTFVVMLGAFGMPLAFSFYLSFTGYAQGQGRRRVDRRSVGWRCRRGGRRLRVCWPAALRAGRRVRISAAAPRQTSGVFAPIRSPCFIARPSPTTSGIRFASDSLLEGTGFELPVPQQIRSHF